MINSLVSMFRRSSQVLLANQALRRGTTHVRNKPFYLYLEITNRCNIACIHCGRTHDPRYQEKSHVGDLPLTLIKKLEPIIPYATFVIPTGVGEPFLNRDLIPTISFLKNLGAAVSITSNGTILNDRICGEIIESGLDKIVFSLDGARPETYNSIRAGADFDRVVGHIKNLVAIRDRVGSKAPLVEVEMIAMAENFFDLPRLPDLAVELGAIHLLVETLFEHSGEAYGKILQRQSLTNIDWKVAQPIWEQFVESARRKGLALSSSLLQRDLRTVFRVPEEVAREGQRQTLQTPDYQTPTADHLVQIKDQKSHFDKVFCTQPWSVLYVTWKGEVRTCCFNETVLGDLNRNTIEEIWNGSTYQAFRRSILDRRVPSGCHDCLQGGFNFDVVPRVEPALMRSKLGKLKRELAAAIR